MAYVAPPAIAPDATADGVQPDPPSIRPQHNAPRSARELADQLGFAVHGELDGVEITGVTVSTKDVHAGDLFVAIAGARAHGASYAAAARDLGAVAVLTDAAGVQTARESGLPVLEVSDVRAHLGAVSAWLYRTSVPGLTLYAVTGTNGKTSTVYILEALLRQLGLVTGLSSTAERHVGSLNVVSGLTTPEASDLHGLIARMREEKVTDVAVEVSAQALSRHRVDGLMFDVAGFTNISHDHLDDYGDMQTYVEAKSALFQPDRARRAVICLDSEWADYIVEHAAIPVTTVSSRPSVPGDWNVEVTGETAAGVSFTLTAPDGTVLSSRVPLLGAHMATNAALAIAMTVDAGHPLASITEALERDGEISVYAPGRTERVSGERGPAVFVDFGHSPDAFAKTLAAVRGVTPAPGRVIMVFGADGDRDKLKRPAMSAAAVAGSDILVITDHHPRFEDPDSIREALLAAAREADASHETYEIAGPVEAIRFAVSLAREGDSILWAGPGHQNYRDIRGVHVPYSARAEARKALAEAGWE